MPSSSRVRGFDFSVPEQVLKCLWQAQFGARIDPAILKRFWHRDLAIVKRTHAAVFNPALTDPAAAATSDLISGLAEGKHPRGASKYHMPREWLFIFHEAFQAGLIGAHAWGKAARIIYVASEPPLGGSKSASTDALNALRSVTRPTFMDMRERGLWMRLPPFVTLYRGSCALPGSLDQACNGLSWTRDPKLAVTYAHARTLACYQQGREGGVPTLIEAHVPKGAVIGVTVLPDGSQVEAIVDYERVPADGFKVLGSLDTEEKIAGMVAHWRKAAKDPALLAAVA